MSRSVVITGASRGIGRAITRRLAKPDTDYDRFVLMARPSSNLDDTVAELQQNRRLTVIPVEVDFEDRDAVVSAADSAFQAVGNIDVLINNAGYTNPVAVHQVRFEDFERTMMVNLYSPFTLIQELLHKGNRFGTIVNIASTAGIKGRSGWLTYSASKAALINMSEVLREELSIFGTRVVSISPGRTATDLRTKLAPEEDPSTIMQASHVAEVVHTALGPAGRFLDSENLVVRQ